MAAFGSLINAHLLLQLSASVECINFLTNGQKHCAEERAAWSSFFKEIGTVGTETLEVVLLMEGDPALIKSRGSGTVSMM